MPLSYLSDDESGLTNIQIYMTLGTKIILLIILLHLIVGFGFIFSLFFPKKEKKKDQKESSKTEV